MYVCMYVCMYVYMYVCMYVCIYVTRSAKTRHNSAFLEIDIFASVCLIYVPKALFCVNIKSVLQVVFQLQG